MEQFKEIHKEHDSLTHSSYSTGELRKDMTAMEEERELLTQRISKSKQRIQTSPGYEEVGSLSIDPFDMQFHIDWYWLR